MYIDSQIKQDKKNQQNISMELDWPNSSNNMGEDLMHDLSQQKHKNEKKFRSRRWSNKLKINNIKKGNLH